MQIGVISDTHGHLDSSVLDFFSGCNEIWHAGDIGSMNVIEKLSSVAQVRAVYGNIDAPEITNSFGEEETFKIDSTVVYVTHITGRPSRYNPKVRRMIQKHQPSILVGGHSHILKVSFDHENQLLFINPGAAGNQGFHKMKTVIRFRLKEKPVDLEVFEIGRRGRIT